MYNPYADEFYATDYLEYRLDTTEWDTAPDKDRRAALQMASDDIDHLPLRGYQRTEGQPRRFPRDYAPNDLIPDPVKKACVELALTYLKGVDPQAEYDLLTRREVVYSTLREQRVAERVEPHIAAGIPNLRAFTLLVPFLRDERTARLVKGT